MASFVPKQHEHSKTGYASKSQPDRKRRSRRWWFQSSRPSTILHRLGVPNVTNGTPTMNSVARCVQDSNGDESGRHLVNSPTARSSIS